MKERHEIMIGVAILAIVFGAGLIVGYRLFPKTAVTPTETATSPAGTTSSPTETPENPFVKINREIRELMEFNITSIDIAIFPKDNLEGYQIALMREQPGCGGIFIRLYRKLLEGDMDKVRILIIMRNYAGLFQFLDSGGFERIEFVDSGENGFSSDRTDILMIKGKGAKNEIITNGSEFDVLYLEKINVAYRNILDRMRQSFLERRFTQDEETSEEKNNRLTVVQKVIDGLP